MSTTHAPLPASRQPDKSAHTADSTLPAPGAAECPSCGASVRNISVQPGESIRCLNCGARFTPVQVAGDAPIAGSSGEEVPSAAIIREPQSAGYWFLRIPAMITAGVSVLLYIALNITAVKDLMNPYRRARGFWFDVLPFLVFPLIPLAGFFLFAITRALARVEASAIKAAWRSGLLKGPLPSAPGSSLPYIVPISVGPILVALVLLVSEYNQRRDATIAVAALFEFPIFFLMGFMCDDLRQFFWRQQALAGACSPNPAAPTAASARRFPWLGVLLALMLLAWAAFIFGIRALAYNARERMIAAWPEVTHNYDEYKAFALLGATLIGVALTVFLLARNFQRSIDAWWLTAARAGVGEAERGRDRITNLAVAAPFWIYCFLCLSMVAKVILEHDGPETSLEIFAVCACAAAGALLCFALPRLFADVRSWRRAQAQFWIARNLTGQPPRLPRLLACTVYATIVFSVMSAGAFLFDGWKFAAGRTVNHFIVEVLLMSVLLCLPAILIALLAREFMLADRMAVELQRGDRQDGNGVPSY